MTLTLTLTPRPASMFPTDSLIIYMSMRILSKNETSARAIILLHGYLGNDRSMDIFARPLGKNSTLLSPQGYYPVGEDQFTWADPNVENKYSWKAYREPAIRLHQEIQAQLTLLPEVKEIVLIGFSQGGALAYTLLAMYPESYPSIIALSGFMPIGLEAKIDADKLTAARVYISHGIHDDIVPVMEARKARDLLISLGVDVNYCEGDGKHKISLTCLKDIAAYLNG